MLRSGAAVTIVCITVCITVLLAHARESRAPQQNPLRVDLDLVLVNVTVTDPENRLVTGLERKNFQLSEDKVEQSITYFSAEDSPLSTCIVLDTSNSMKNKIAIAKKAVEAFLKAGNPEDEYLLVDFNDRAEIAEGFTSDIRRLQDWLVPRGTKGMTALYDAMYLAVQKVRDGRNPKKAVLLITDGDDNHSDYTFANVRDLIRESDVQIYAIGILGNSWVARVSNFGFPDLGRAAIQDLAEIGGGQAFFPRSLDELEDIASRIAVELKNQYVLGYVSTNQKKDGKWRKIRVMVNPPSDLSHLIIRAKRGYFARTE